MYRWHSVASSPGHSQILSRSRGEKSGEGLGSLLRHGPEMVDSVRNVDSVSCSVGWKCVYDVKGQIRQHASSHSLCIDGI